MKILDTTSALTQEIVNDLARANFVAILKYSADSEAFPAKRAGHEEAAMLHKAGMGLGFISEHENTHASYFTAAQGEADAKEAVAYFRLLGVPAETPCFASFDFDATDDELVGPISDYATEFHNTMKAGGYLMGVYGSGKVCQHLKEMGVAHYTFLAESTGWEGSAVPFTPDLVQSTESFPGLDSDIGTANTLALFWGYKEL